MRRDCALLLLFLTQCTGIQNCSMHRHAAVNVVVSCQTGTCLSEELSTTELPALPEDSPVVTWGPPSDCRDFDGEIVVAATASLSVTDAFYSTSTMVRRATVLFLNHVNHERRGLLVGNKRYSMRVVRVGDGSSVEQVTNATAHAVRDHDADFVLAPYSSGLTRFASMQAEADGKVMLAATASAPSIYTSNLTFGTLPSSVHYMRETLEAVLSAARGCDAQSSCVAECRRPWIAAATPGESSCVGSIKVGFLQHSDVFPRAVCSTAAEELGRLGIGFAADATGGPMILTVVPEAGGSFNATIVEETVQQLKHANVTVVVGCTYFASGSALVSALERLDYSPLAVAVTASLSDTPLLDHRHP